MPIVEGVTTNTVAKVLMVSTTSIALTELIYNAEFLTLLWTSLFAASTSYFYDWVHRDPRKIGLRELSEFIKYLLYGSTFMFVVFYVGVNHGSEYVNLPKTAWGFIAAISAGSAVAIVDWVLPTTKNLLVAFSKKWLGVK